MDAHATHAALEILVKGGNAVDAAVAAAAVLGVTEPFSCGIGGGGVMVCYLAALQRATTFDHRECAPREVAAISGRMHSAVDPATGPLFVGVPGMVRGWEAALRQYGRMDLAGVLEPAIRVAEEGFTVDAVLEEQTRGNLDRLRAFASTSALFLTTAGQALPAGSMLRNPDLATAYRLIAREGVDVFYRGQIARAICQTVEAPPLAPDASFPAERGVMTREDLRLYEARERMPVVSTYRGSAIYGMGLPSSGGLTIACTLNLLEGFDLGASPRAIALHYYTEASRLAFADREATIGDPEFVRVPIDWLLSPAYASERRQRISAHAASYSIPSANAKRSTERRGGEGHSTAHLTVADREGNIVCYTLTIGSIGGSGMVVPGYGFLLNSELTDFTLIPNHPNAPAGGKRPRSSMSPTIVFRDRRPVLALGSPGGIAIIPAVTQVLLNVLDFRLPLLDAITAPRVFPYQAAGVPAEARFLSSPEARALERLGHWFTDAPESGEITAIQFEEDGTVIAAAEPERRGGGSVRVEGPEETV